MFRVLSRVLALCMVSFAMPAFAQQYTDNTHLLRQLPSPDRVLAAVPSRKDPVETELLRIGVLQEFNSLAQSLALSRMPKDLVDASNQYYAAQAQMREALLKRLGGDQSPQARQAAERRLRDVAESLFKSPREFVKLRRQMYANVLDGELRDYALAWHDNDPSMKSVISYMTPGWVRQLPAPLVGIADTIFTLPALFWLGLLAAWGVLGIAFRTSPFHLLPTDVWTLQRGRQRVPIAHRVSTVIEVRESLETVDTTVEERDGNNNPVATRTFTRNYHHVNLFLRSQDGEHTVTLTNQGFNARAGHRILEVWDPKKDMYLFFYNYDLKTFLPMGHIDQFVKMRPKILIPVWLLTLYGALTFAPMYLPWATYGTPVVYLMFMNILNRRRRKKFKREMAAEMIAATSASSAPDYIGNADYGVVRA